MSDLKDSIKSQLRGAYSKNKEVYFFLMLTAVTWLLARYVLVGPFAKDNNLITQALCWLFVVQTVGLYYLLGRWFFPRYVYTRKIWAILLFLPLCFLLVYWSNFLVLGLLVPFSDGVTAEGDKTWITFIWKTLSEAGWLGCFTNGVAAYWNFAFSLEIVLVYLAFKIFKDILLSRENKQRLEKENITLELDFLKSQINPHFLFNALNSIYSRTVDVSEEGSELVLKLADLMRYSLYRTRKEQVPLSDELKYIQNYTDLEKCRYGEWMDISFDTDGAAQGYRIAPLLLIPLVENAFKHGIGRKGSKNPFVKISAVIEDDILYFSVENSFPGGIKKNILPDDAGTDGGIGIATLKRRLDLLYPGSYRFSVETSDYCYEVMLQVPLIRETVATQVGEDQSTI